MRARDGFVDALLKYLHVVFGPSCLRMRGAHYLSEPSQVLGVHLHGFEQILTRGITVLSNCGCEMFGDAKRELVVAAQHAPRYREIFAQQRLRFGKVVHVNK